MIQTETGKSQRNNRNISPYERSGNPGWIELPVQPGSKPCQRKLNVKGGDKNKTFLGFKKKHKCIRIGFTQEKREKSAIQNNSMNEKQKINAFIRAARLAHQRGFMQEPDPNPTAIEQIGIRINILRRQRQKNLTWMHEKTGYRQEELVAFEAGILSTEKMLEMLPGILAALELNMPTQPHIFSPHLSIF